jgi:cob(I)alamin adenosyltransferase
MKIYTKFGDTGKTSLLNERVSKTDLRIETNGQIDELLVLMAYLIENVKSDEEDITKDLQIIYKRLFIISSIIADVKDEFNYVVEDQNVQFLEERIDKMSGDLPKLKNFIYYTGSQNSMLAHQIRAKARSVERAAVRVFENDEFEPIILVYLNRLSDYFYTLARYLNIKSGNEEDTLKV